MAIKFPKSEGCQLKDDPMAKLKQFTKLHGFDGRKKYFWIAAPILKAFCLFLRIIFLYSCLDQPKRVAELVTSFPVSIMGFFKLVYFYYNKRRVDYLYNTITSEFWDYRICGSQVEKEALNKFAFTNRIVFLHFAASCICLLFFIAFPVADMPSEYDRTLPNVIWAPFDLNPSPVYEITFGILLINVVLSVFGNVFYDFFYVYCVQHLYVQFIILKRSLANITDGIMELDSDVEKFHSPYFQKIVINRVKLCALHHSKLLRYGKNIESYCSKILIPQLIMTYAALVIIGFMLCLDRSNILKSLALFNLSLSTYVQLVLFAIFSSQLNEQTISVIDAIYESKWYLFNARIKKACTFMMMNAKEGSIVIKAGGSTNIDNPLLINMLQKVFSAITLLNALVDEDNSN